MSEDEATVPDPVKHLWDCVQEALEAVGNPSAKEIDRLAAQLDLILPSSTVEGWLAKGSVVPAWEKFRTLTLALGAEKDRDWKALHGDALRADRILKSELRRQKQETAPPIPQPEAEPPTTPVAPPVPAPPVPRTGKTSRWSNLRRGWLVLAVSSALIVAAIVVTQLGWNFPSSLLASSTTSRRCAYVTQEPAGVYVSPDTTSRVIKSKYSGERVEVMDQSQSSGWVAVKLPRDREGMGWMEVGRLTPVGVCTTPLPGK